MRVLVVGGGLAGTMAAIAAARHGAEVTLVSRAPGATALYGGGMEIGAGPSSPVPPQPEHPFSRLDLEPGSLVAELEEACAALVEVVGRAGLDLRGDWRHSGCYADLHGRSHVVQLVPASVAGGELSALRGRRVGVIAIEQVGDYDARVVAEGLGALGIDARAVPLPVDGLPPAASLADLGGRTAARPTDDGADVYAYPPGFDGLPEEGFELLARVPSAHGWRLQRALEQAPVAEGVRCLRGEVSAFEIGDGRLLAARVGREVLEADSFILASGRFIGGGLRKDRLVREPLLGLDVFWDGEPLETVYWQRVRHLETLSPEPAFQVGLRIDRELRPLDAQGRRAHPNLRAAGSVLAGWAHLPGQGFGVPLLTGWRSGKLAAS